MKNHRNPGNINDGYHGWILKPPNFSENLVLIDRPALSKSIKSVIYSTQNSELSSKISAYQCKLSEFSENPVIIDRPAPSRSQNPTEIRPKSVINTMQIVVFKGKTSEN